MKKIIAMLLVVVLCCSVSVGLTLAYLTDRDSEANIFTVGDVEIDLTEDFEQGATLLPGLDITKRPVITNTGDNDAWVWMTVAIPTDLDVYNGTAEGSSENIIHWNYLGATSEEYISEERIVKAVADGYLPDGTTYADIVASNSTWDCENTLLYQEEIDGVSYNVYTLLYNKILTPNEVTLPSLVKVYLDARVDIDPDGNWHLVDNGNVTDINWNTEEDGGPVIYVSAYAMQAEGFDTVLDAYNAYQAQWGNHGGVEFGNANP
jgi:predicted ribosomally synthesized peptide with SipW-like signal peptide